MTNKIFLLPQYILIAMPFLFFFSIGVWWLTKDKKDEDELKSIMQRTNQSFSDRRVMRASSLEEKELTFIQRQNAKLNLLGLNYKFETLVLISFGLFIACFVISHFLFKAGIVLMTYLGIVGAGMVFIFVNNMLERKKEDLTIEFLEKLRDISSYLSVGKTLGNSIDEVLHTGHISAPLYREFERVKIDMRTGRTMHEAFFGMYSRLGIDEIRVFAQTIQVFEETGGNLIEIMKAQDAFFMSKIETKNEQKVFISELKTSQKFIVGIPLAMVLGVFILNPSFFGDFYGTGLGQMIAIIAISMLLLGLYLSNQLAKLK